MQFDMGVSGPDDPQLYLGAYALWIDGDERLLLARLATGADRGRWTLPGGGVEPHEHPNETVRREVHEETGAQLLSIGRVVAIYSHVYEQTAERRHSVHHVGIVYEIDGIAEALRFEADGSTDRCEWFAREQAASLPLVPLARFGVSLAWPTGDSRPERV